MVYAAWSKPGSTIESKLEEFGRVAGYEALECVKKLYERHAPWNPTKGLAEPCAVTWEDSWSSKELGTRANGFQGTRDREGASLLDLLGKNLRTKGLKFTDPTFPPGVESLFVYPSTAAKHAGVSAGPRIDTSPFLAGLDPANIKWSRPEEIFPGRAIHVRPRPRAREWRDGARAPRSWRDEGAAHALPFADLV